jgi:hypothetical protein
MRYTNNNNISNAKTRVDNIKTELDKRPTTLAKIDVQPLKLNQEEPVMTTTLPTINVTPEVTKAGPGNIFKRMYNSVKGLGDPDKFWR